MSRVTEIARVRVTANARARGTASPLGCNCCSGNDQARGTSITLLQRCSRGAGRKGTTGRLH